MVLTWRKILESFSKPKKVVLFKAKSQMIFIMTKDQMTKQKVIIIFITFSVICIKKQYLFLVII